MEIVALVTSVLALAVSVIGTMGDRGTADEGYLRVMLA